VNIKGTTNKNPAKTNIIKSRYVTAIEIHLRNLIPSKKSIIASIATDTI
jgi:hypothetical protein